jgi:Uma2 family endonuclease
MTTAINYFTLEQYLNYSDNTDTRYELENGQLLPMAQPTGEHGSICEFLYDTFRDQISTSRENWTVKLSMVAIQSPRGGGWETARIPDVMVLDQDQWKEMRDREAMIYLNEPPPLLVVEVVSESTRNTDDRAKRVEYNVLDIPEYWVVDPQQRTVTVFQSVDQLYEGRELKDRDRVISSIFPELEIKVEEIFNLY